MISWWVFLSVVGVFLALLWASMEAWVHLRRRTRLDAPERVVDVARFLESWDKSAASASEGAVILLGMVQGDFGREEAVHRLLAKGVTARKEIEREAIGLRRYHGGKLHSALSEEASGA